MTKKHRGLLVGYRLKLAAFFHSEYAMRHILTNKAYNECVAYVPIFKEKLMQIFEHMYSEDIVDAFVEHHVFFNEKYHEMDVYSSVLNRRLVEHLHWSDVKINSLFAKVCETIADDQKLSDFISKISEISVKHGVYATHVDSFRMKKYSLSRISNENILFSTEKMFFNKEFFDKMNDVTTWFAMQNTCDTPLNKRIPADQVLSIFIDVESNFDFDDIVNKIKSILAMVVSESNAEKRSDDDSVSRYYLNTFFNPKWIKDKENEISNRLFGLIMWDNVEFKKMTQKEAFIDTFGVIKLYRDNTECDADMCNTDCVDFDDCFNSARRLYRTASNSIKKGRILTSKDEKIPIFNV
ncbi:MAG TPA: hypothetical protein DCX03_05165 [Bacteroidales bacterium]|nr:hypothetical protein [Bacteroidales bacterium]